tara:strand:+ start:14 stop:478 length:465 start_codon:yes stop_codon:yes gene_type:complete
MKFIKILGVAIFVYCCLGIFNVLQAQHNIATPDGPLYEQPGMIKKPVPVYCGPTEFMLNAAIEKFNQEPLVVGKVIIPQTGEVIAMLTVFVAKDHEFDMSVLMTMLDKNETCVLGYAKELMFYEEGDFEHKKEDKVEPEGGSYNGVWKKVNLNL